MRAFKLIIAGGLLLFLAAAIGAGYILFLRPLTLPVYHMAQHPTDGGSFMATTLTYGGRIYISDTTEFPLELTSTWVGKDQMIGRTEDGMDIYAIPEQDPQNYIMLTTFMFPRQIFRNTNLPPVLLSGTHFDELQLLENMGAAPLHQTREQAVIAEAVDHLDRREGAAKGAQPERVQFLRLVSDKLPGLAYSLYAYANNDGAVFLADRFAPDEWIPAGPAFTDWFNQSP